MTRTTANPLASAMLPEGKEVVSKTSRENAKSTADRIVQELRTMALAAAEGAYLGGEEALCDRFAASAPTLRQAARLLEHEGVLKVKRGVRGGYYAVRPQIETITSIGGTYLRSAPHSMQDIAMVMRALTPLIVQLAIGSERIGEFAEFAAEAPDSQHADYFEQESRFIRLLLELTGNSALQLMHAIFFQFGRTVPQHRAASSEAVESLRQLRVSMALALIEGDQAKATEIALERHRRVSAGIARNLAEDAVTQSIQAN